MSGRITAIAVLIIALGVPALAHGAKPVAYVADGGDPAQVFFKKAGLKLKGNCISTAVDVRAIRNVPKHKAAMFGANAQSDITESGSSHQNYFGVKKLYSKTDNFQLLTTSGLNAFDSSVGQLIQAERRRVLTIEWMAEAEGDALGSDCLFGGTQRVAKKGSNGAIIYRANAGPKTRTIYNDGLVKLRAKCTPDGNGGDLDLFAKAGVVTFSTYANSQSDADGNGLDEAAYSQAEDMSNDTAQLDVSGVQDDNATGQIVINSSNEQFAFDWIASSSHALGRDCAFAATVVQNSAADDGRVAGSSYGPQPLTQFFDHGGVQLSMSCSATPDIYVQLGSAVAGSSAHWGMQSDANGDTLDSHNYMEADDLAMVDVPLLSSTEDENLIGELVYARPGPKFTSLQFMTDEEGIFGHADCAVAGTSQVATG